MSTRGLEAAEEDALTALSVLLFDADGTLESIITIDPADIQPPNENNERELRVSLPSGSYNVVALANAGELVAAPPYTSNPVGQVLVGSLYWARTDAIGGGQFASSEMAYNNVQFNWHEATTGVIGATSGGISGTNVQGICPSGWRLPTNTEYSALYSATTWTWKSSAPTGYTVSGGSGGSLFFPASGRSDGGAYQGSGGCYWSSVETNASNAYGLIFDSSGVYPALNDSKTNAFSVRCVQDAPETSASTSAGVDDISVGQTYSDVVAALVGHLSYKMYEDGGAIPMWGESGVVAVSEALDLNIDLHRAIARVDVDVASSVTNFEMTQVVVARPNNKYSVIPSALDADGVPNAPSIPGATTADPNDDAAAFSIEDSEALFAYTGSEFVREIYVPEAELVDAEYEDRMALVVGGRYNGSGDVTWYRLDFEGANGVAGLVDVVRNHLYTFTVSSVHGPGSEDVETAYQSYSSYMSVTVVDWNEVHFAPEL